MEDDRSAIDGLTARDSRAFERELSSAIGRVSAAPELAELMAGDAGDRLRADVCHQRDVIARRLGGRLAAWLSADRVVSDSFLGLQRVERFLALAAVLLAVPAIFVDLGLVSEAIGHHVPYTPSPELGAGLLATIAAVIAAVPAVLGVLRWQALFVTAAGKRFTASSARHRELAQVLRSSLDLVVAEQLRLAAGSPAARAATGPPPAAARRAGPPSPGGAELARGAGEPPPADAAAPARAWSFPKRAPALVELSVVDPIPTSTLGSIERFIADHQACAIGVAGPRGSGKSTILRHLAQSRDATVGVYVPAAVRYEPNELLRRLFEAIAREIGGEDAPVAGAGVRRPAERAVHRRLGAAGLLVALAYGAAALLVLGGGRRAPHLDFYQWVGAGLAACTVGLAAAWWRIVSQSRDRSPASQAAVEPGVVLERLRLKRSRTAESAVSISALSGVFKLAATEATTVTEKELGRARLVADFHAFVRLMLSSQTTPPVDRLVVALDEMDKLPTPDETIAVVNELKDVLHIERTHFLVAMSSDALDRFALRGAPDRDAFDSTFDHTVEVEPLRASESLEVIGRRATRFPAGAGLLCHVLAGGLARDVVRAARRCVEIANADDGQELWQIAHRLVAGEVRRRLVAALRIDGHLATMAPDRLRELSRAVAELELDVIERAVPPGAGSRAVAGFSDWLAVMKDVVALFCEPTSWSADGSLTADGECRALELATSVAGLSRAEVLLSHELAGGGPAAESRFETEGAPDGTAAPGAVVAGR